MRLTFKFFGNINVCIRDSEDTGSNNDHGVNSETRQNSQKPSMKHRLSQIVNIIRLVSRSNNIKLTSSNHLALGRSTRVINKFFSEKCSDGFESKSRRFLVKGNGEIAYQSDSKPITMKLEKLVVSLVFNSDKLFSYLKATAKKNSGVTAYTLDEKEFIKQFVRASNYNPRHSITSQLDIRRVFLIV